jgi:hypothetical protein
MSPVLLLGEHEEALHDADRYGRLHASSLGQNIYLTMRGISNAYRGEPKDARGCLAQALAQSGSGANSERAQLYVPKVIHHAMLARDLWMQGYASEALESAEQSVALAVESGHALSVCFAAALAGCPVALWGGERATAYRRRLLLEEHSGALAVVFWRNFADVYRYCMASDIGSQGNRPQAQYHDRSQWSYRHLGELSVMGEGLASRQMIERALSSDPIWCSAEVLRLEATRRLREEGASAMASVMSMLALSLDIARRQGAYAWELRAAATEGDLLCLQGRVRDSRDRLEIVLQGRPDERETPDSIWSRYTDCRDGPAAVPAFASWRKSKADFCLKRLPMPKFFEGYCTSVRLRRAMNISWCPSGQCVRIPAPRWRESATG